MIRHGFRNLARFAGRDARSTFWPFAGVVVGGGMAAMTMGMVPMLVGTVGRLQRFAAAHPDQADVRRHPGGGYEIAVQGYHPELMPNLTLFTALVGGVALVVVVLLAAAVVRRLHDGGLSGAWGLMPVPFLAAGFVLMPMVMAGAGEPSPALFAALFLNNLVYLAMLATLVVLLCRRTAPGANRFGAPADPS